MHCQLHLHSGHAPSIGWIGGRGHLSALGEDVRLYSPNRMPSCVAMIAKRMPLQRISCCAHFGMLCTRQHRHRRSLTIRCPCLAMPCHDHSWVLPATMDPCHSLSSTGLPLRCGPLKPQLM